MEMKTGIRYVQWIMALIGLLGLCFVPGARAATATPLPPVTEAEGRLGTCYAFYDDQWMIQAYEAGSRWDRFDFRWNAIELYGYDGHDAILDRYAALGNQQLQVVGILGATPEAYADCPSLTRQRAQALTDLPLGPVRAWTLHTNDPGWPGNPPNPATCPPLNLDLPWDHPENHWSRFVQTTVTRYRGRVDTWEIWNEADLPGFWQGTPQQYAQLLKVGYRAVKAANPQATVLFGGLAYWGDQQFYLDVLDALATDPESTAHNGYFDVMSLHLYADVEFAHTVSAAVRQEVAARVGPHPLWLTEAGVRIWDEDNPPPGWEGEWPPYYSATGAEAAAYVIQAYAGARAAGVERFFIFRMHDDHPGMPGQRYGLTRDDHSLRPSYVAYQVAARYLRGENQITGPFGTSVRRITFWGSPHGRIDVLWNHTPEARTYQHPALLPQAKLVDQEGTQRWVQADDGVFTLELLPATNNNHPEGRYLIGGAPVLLIQEDLQPPVSTLHPLPSFTVEPEVTVRWTASDAGSGLWYLELERAPTTTGPWILVAGWGETQGATEVTAPLPGPGTWYFRGRARDRAGNWEAWPAIAETSTTLQLTRPVALFVAVFSDLNGDGAWGNDEPELHDTLIRWKDGNGTLVAEQVGGSWTLTETVPIGSHTLHFHHPEHLPARYSFEVLPGEGSQIVTRTQGLRPITDRLYLPVISREAD